MRKLANLLSIIAFLLLILSFVGCNTDKSPQEEGKDLSDLITAAYSCSNCNLSQTNFDKTEDKWYLHVMVRDGSKTFLEQHTSIDSIQAKFEAFLGDCIQTCDKCKHQIGDVLTTNDGDVFTVDSVYLHREFDCMYGHSETNGQFTNERVIEN